jgi:hypothetical protein
MNSHIIPQIGFVLHFCVTPQLDYLQRLTPDNG